MQKSVHKQQYINSEETDEKTTSWGLKIQKQIHSQQQATGFADHVAHWSSKDELQVEKCAVLENVLCWKIFEIRMI